MVTLDHKQTYYWLDSIDGTDNQRDINKSNKKRFEILANTYQTIWNGS